MTDEEWNTGWVRSLALRLGGEFLDMVNESGERLTDDTLLILLNASELRLSFSLPETDRSQRWSRALDTADPAADAFVWAGEDVYELEARSMAVFSSGGPPKRDEPSAGRGGRGPA